MDPANKKEYTGIIKKLHNMQWLKKNSMSGHKDKAPEEPSNNMNLENSTSDSGNVASTSKTTDEVSVAEKEPANAWTKNINIADTLFPNVQSLAIQRLDEQEMLSLALTESIMTAQLEAIKLKEAEKEAQQLERKNHLLVRSDSEEDSIWDKPNRQNVPTDYPEALKADSVKEDEEEERHEKAKEKTKDLIERIEGAEHQIKDVSFCTVTENSVKDDHKEDGKTIQDTVDAMISDKSQNSNSQTESSVIQSKDLLEENKEIKTSKWEKQLIKGSNDVAKHDKKQQTTRQKHAGTAEKSISYPKTNFNRSTEKSSHVVKKEESKIRPTNSSSSTTYRLSSTEYKYPGSARKSDLSQNRQHEPEDVASKYVGQFYVRNDAARVANRRQSNSYRKYDTRYVLIQAGSTNEERNSEPRKDFGTSCTESTLSRNAQSEPNRNMKQAMIRKTEPETIPQKLMQLNDKSDYEHDLQESDNRQSDDNNNNKSGKIIGSVGENDPLLKDDSLSVESKECTEQTENLMMLSDCPGSVMKRAEENNVRGNENKNSNALNHSQSSIVPRPILARNIPNNAVDVPSEMLRCQNVPNNIQRSVLQSSGITRDIFNGNENTMPPPELSHRNAILPSSAVCQEIYNSNHSTVSPPPGFYNHQQTLPVSNQWNSHVMSVQHQNSGPMCGNYLLPQQYSCAPFPDSCFAGLETHQQAQNFAVPCGQAVHVINPMYGSCYTIPANMYEDMCRNSHSDAANNPSFPSTSVNTRNEMRSRESQDIRIGIDVRMNRCQTIYAPEQRHNYGSPLISSTPYDDGSGRFDQLSQASNAIMRLNYKCGDGAVDFAARVGAEDRTNQVQLPIANPREHLDSEFPARRMGIGRGRLRPRDA